MTERKSDIVEFLLARITEEEATARASAMRAIVGRHTRKVGEHLPKHPICAECGGADWKPIGGVLEPFPWVMPWPCHTLRLLAQPYSDHPDFDPAWAER